MKFLIAGLGSIGRRHLRNLRLLGEEDILLYRTHRATLPDADLAGLPVETDLEAALNRGPDAVIVANPTALHLDIAVPAAQAGCHILIEKPVSHSMERIDHLQEAVRANGCRVLVGFQFRFHPGLRQVGGWLNEGVIGEPVSVGAHWGEYLPDWHPWEDYRTSYAARPELGGGVVRTLCHPIDYLRMLLGEIGSVHGTTGDLGLQLHVEDTAEISLRFESGVIGGVHLNYNQRPPRHDLEIVGTGGTIRWDNADGAARLYRAQDPRWQAVHLPEGFERNDLFLAEMRHFLAVLREGQPPACSLDDGIRALQLSLAVLGHNQD